MGKPRRAASGRSALKLESLEARQLLATIVAGSGTEVGTDIKAANGNTFDQILLTGSSISVKADPGQIVRISFLDLTGDIVQTEFSGSGTLSVSLEALRTAGTTGYVNNNPDQFIAGKKVDYVQGLASILITDPASDSNIGIFSAGIVTNPGLFAGQTRQGGNNIADIARLQISGTDNNSAGFYNFGGIRAGNAVFAASSGIVGIRAENIAVQQVVAIGDIEAAGSGVPTLLFNTNSQFQTVFVRGGDLFQPNGRPFDGLATGQDRTLGGFSSFGSTEGSTSGGRSLPALPIGQESTLGLLVPPLAVSGDWFFDWRNMQSVEVVRDGANVSSLYGGDWLAKGGIQASLDYVFSGRNFSGEIFIIGDLAPGLDLHVAGAKNVSLYGNLSGRFLADGYGASVGTLTINGNLNGSVLVRGLDRSSGAPVGDQQTNVLGALVVNGSTGPFADIRAERIDDVHVMRDFSGVISTNVNAPNGSAIDNHWDGSPAASSTYVDYEGAIGSVSIGYDLSGINTGGSIINGTIQGMAGIGSVVVGGDVFGFAPGTGVFVTASNPAAGATDTARFGTANIGTIAINGDVALSFSNQRLVHIAGNGNYGDISIAGLSVTSTAPGTKVGAHSELVASSESLIRILSPFTDANFKASAAQGQILVPFYDPDGLRGPLDGTYLVTAADVAAGAQLYSINADGTPGALGAAKAGDRVPVVVNNVVSRDGLGNIVYAGNTALFQPQTRFVDDFGAPSTKKISGDRGNLDGAFNNFGRIEIAGLPGAPGTTTGSVTWTDSADQYFGGITLNTLGVSTNGEMTGTIGSISINNTAGAKSDLVFLGLIGTASGQPSVALSALTVNGVEDIRFGQMGTTLDQNALIRVTGITNGVKITTAAGAYSGPLGAVSPSVNFDSGFLLNSGTTKSGGALLEVNASALNSTIGFNSNTGLVVTGSNGPSADLGAVSLTADYVNFAGTMSARKIDAVSIAAGRGIGLNPSTAITFTGNMIADTWAGFTATATEGDVRFVPGTLKAASPGIVKTTVGPITLSTAGKYTGGDIFLGAENAAPYSADFGDITLAAGHLFAVASNGNLLENIGNIAINFATTQLGSIGNLTATTSAGKITDVLTIQGSAGNITYKAGAAALDQPEFYFGAPGNAARVGTITTNQTIWGTRGATVIETSGQRTDGSAQTLDYTIRETNYKILPAGYIYATLNYAGNSTAAGNALSVRTGSGGAVVNYNVIGNDDNLDGILSATEIGHGGNAAITSISGDIQFNSGTQLPDFANVATMGNITIKTATFAQDSGLISNTEKGEIEIVFKDLPGGPASSGGFEGSIGNISATTTGGSIFFAQTRFDGAVGNLSLTASSVAHIGGVAIGNISTTGIGVTFGSAHGQISTSVAPGGIIDTRFNSLVTGITPWPGDEFDFTLSAEPGAGGADAPSRMSAGVDDSSDDTALDVVIV